MTRTSILTGHGSVDRSQLDRTHSQLRSASSFVAGRWSTPSVTEAFASVRSDSTHAALVRGQTGRRVPVAPAAWLHRTVRKGYSSSRGCSRRHCSSCLQGWRTHHVPTIRTGGGSDAQSNAGGQSAPAQHQRESAGDQVWRVLPPILLASATRGESPKPSSATFRPPARNYRSSLTFRRAGITLGNL